MAAQRMIAMGALAGAMLVPTWLGVRSASAAPPPVAPAVPAPPAEPGPDIPAQVEKLAEEAHVFYREGRFDVAVARYLEAYRLEPSARLLYNIAFIYDTKLKELDLAIEYYKRYAKAPDAEPEVVERTITRLTQLRELQERQKAEARPEIVKVAEPPGPDLAAPGWGLFAAGLAVGAVGAAFAGAAFADQQAFASELPGHDRDMLRQEGQRFALAADILMATGAAALVTGIVLLAIPTPDPPPVSASAIPMPGGLCLTLGGRL